MTSSKIRTAAVAFIASLSIGGVAAAEAMAVKSTTTGSSSLEQFCRDAAQLISETRAQAAYQSAAGNHDEAQAFMDLANEMMHRSEEHGCTFAARKAPVAATAARTSAPAAR